MNENYISHNSGSLISNKIQLDLLEALQNKGASLKTSVIGMSMFPAIVNGDKVTISPLKDHKLIVGDIVAFRSLKNKLVIHRLVKKTVDGWVIKGDNSLSSDGVISQNDILGYVISIEHEGNQVILKKWNFTLVVLQAKYKAIRTSVGKFFDKIQRSSQYRYLFKSISCLVNITVAQFDDMKIVNQYLNSMNVDMSEETPDPNVTNLVAKIGRKIIGFVQLVYHPQEHKPFVGYWLFSLEVWRLFRGMGVGEKLVRRVIQEAVNKEAPDISMTVYEDNTRAISLYKKIGFVQIQTSLLEAVYVSEKQETGRRHIVMQLSLR